MMDDQMIKNEEYVIDESSFEFAQKDAHLHDQKLDTKPVGYLRDAMRRFKKNKSSVAAAIIILLLVLFALFAPVISPYELGDKDPVYTDTPPFLSAFAKAGFWDGGKVYEVQESQYYSYLAMGMETGFDPIIKIKGTRTVTNPRGSTNYYNLRVNQYYAKGVQWRSFTREDFEKIVAFQNETGIQVLYPYYEQESNSLVDGNINKADANRWFKCDRKGRPLNESGKLISNLDEIVPNYALQKNSRLYVPYDSLRIEGDPYDPESGNTGYAYGKYNQSGVNVRICYWNYYIYLNGHTPEYAFGTNVLGQDMLNAVGMGARFSLLLAVCVAAINLVLGTIYGAIEGYYGGAVDMILERVSDILSGIPLMIVVTLFNLHLAEKVGIVPTFILAFIATGWIGTASLVRKQFYRFKNREYVLAARTLGARDGRIMFKHIFPNSIGTIITSCVLVIPGVIGSETMLSYLGIVNLSGSKLTSIGHLMSLGTEAAKNDNYHVLLIPALFLALLMISFNLFGNGLRDAFNPSLRGEEG